MTKITGLERRGDQKLELRATEQTAHITGHAAVFNQVVEIGRWFREKIMPGAFTRAIVEDVVPLLLEHEGLPLARSNAGTGTLKLSEDDIGLYIETDLDLADPDALRAVTKMKRGDLDKMSFAFIATREEWITDGDTELRIIHEVDLYDVSIVTTPAYDGTDVGLRSLEKWRAEQEAERRRHNFRAASMRVRLSKNLDLMIRSKAR